MSARCVIRTVGRGARLRAFAVQADATSTSTPESDPNTPPPCNRLPDQSREHHSLHQAAHQQTHSATPAPNQMDTTTTTTAAAAAAAATTTSPVAAPRPHQPSDTCNALHPSTLSAAAATPTPAPRLSLHCQQPTVKPHLAVVGRDPSATVRTFGGKKKRRRIRFTPVLPVIYEDSVLV